MNVQMMKMNMFALAPKTNVKIFKYIMKIFFQCISKTKFDDISNIQKISSMIFLNMANLEQNNTH